MHQYHYQQVLWIWLSVISLVDDDEDIVNLFTYLLKENGYDVIGFTNPLLLLDYIHYYNNHFVWFLSITKIPQFTDYELANKIQI